MSHTRTLSILLAICAAISATELTNPIVGSWQEAKDRHGRVRIPLQNPRGHSWFVALRMGTPLQMPQFCAIDNNHALSVVMAKDCASCISDRPFVYDQDKSTSYFVQHNKNQVVHDDGFTVEGYMAADTMCMSMFGTKKQYENPTSTVCMTHQFFLLAESQTDWNWSAKATDTKHIDAICGLGKEKSSMNAKGFLARATHEDKLRHNTYSITLVPQKLALPVASDPTIPDDRTELELMQTSFLTLGGYDENDCTSEVTWFDAPHTWNQTLTSLSFDGRPIIEAFDRATVMFETGYPYIGLTEMYFDKISQYLIQSVSREMECRKGEHWGMCRIANRRCEDLSLNYNITIAMNDHEFTIPLQNIATYVNHTNSNYCQMQIALVSKSTNSIILGGAFFTAFVGIFDVDNAKIGFAESARALPGNSIVCVGESCANYEGTVEPSEPAQSGKNALAALLILAGVIVAILVCFSIYICRRRASRNKTESILAEKGGFKMRDEYEEIGDDPNFNLGS